MPTKTAVFLDVRKYDDACEGMRVLRPDEYAQMAGRAGRRGKDVRGLALYLPAHPPLDSGELERMIAGKLSPSSSKLLLHYDFILRVLQRGVAFDLLVERSLFARQRGETLRAIEGDIARIERERAALPLTDAVRSECVARTRIEEELQGTINAARKAPQRALEQWKNTHIGPKWAAGWDAYVKDGMLAREEAAAREDLRVFKLPLSQTRLAPVISVLRALGFVKQPAGDGVGGGDAGGSEVGALCGGGRVEGEGAAAAAGGGEATSTDRELATLTARDLTLKGVLATEVNEGNALLLPELFLSGILRDSCAEDVVAALGLFVGEKEAEEKSQSIASLNLPPAIVAAEALLQDTARRAIAAEDAAGIHSEPNYYALRTLWVEIGGRWMRGASVTELCDKELGYGMYEGNLLRGLMKLANLLTEWLSLASHCEWLDVLDKLRDAPALLLRDIAQLESLYLRL